MLGTAPCAAAPCGSMLRTRDGGRSWAPVPAPRAQVGALGSARNGGLDLLRFADRRDGWAAGSSLFATHDGGATWHAIRLIPPALAISSLETSGGYVYAIANGCRLHYPGNCLPASALYAAAVGSDHWTRVTSPVPYPQDMTRVVVHGANWFVPTVDGILRGRGLTALSTRPNPCPEVAGADVRPAPDLAVGDTDHLDSLCHVGGAGGSTTWQLYGTTDGGRSWARAGAGHWEPSGVYGLADNGHGVLLVAAASGGSEIVRSTDDGTSLTYATVATPSGGFTWSDLGFTTTTQAVAVLPAHGLYLSHDSGRTWARVAF